MLRSSLIKSEKTTREPILIVGAGPQALYFVRELSRLAYPVVIVGRKNEIAMHSRYGERRMVESETSLIQELMRLAKDDGIKNCFVTSGFYLAFLMNQMPEFFTLFDVFPKDVEALRIFLKKTKTYELAKSVACKYPESTILSQINQHDDCSAIQFPQIVKWNQDIFLYEKPGFKTCVVNSEKEFKNLLQTLTHQEKNALVMQQYLGADLRNNFSFGGYFKEGKLVAGICVNEVRHYRSGVSSMVEEYTGVHAKLIEQKACELIGKTQFTGFMDVEFKIYKNEIYLLEVNPRPFGFIKIMKLKYPDLLSFILGERIAHSKNPKPVQWINCLRDLVVITRNPKQFLHMIWVLLSFRRRIFDVWEISDPKPFFAQLKRN